MMYNARILRLSEKQVSFYWEQILSVYREAFALPPYNRVEADVINFSDVLDRQLQRDDFRFLAALDEVSGEMVGIAYGFTSAPGQWWYDRIAPAAGPRVTTEWLKGSFQLVELAVKPSAQGKKIGSRLHDLVLSDLPHQKAVLSTMQVETVAFKLYRKRGWVALLESFYFPSSPRPYQIMGLDLKKTSPPAFSAAFSGK